MEEAIRIVGEFQTRIREFGNLIEFPTRLETRTAKAFKTGLRLAYELGEKADYFQRKGDNQTYILLSGILEEMMKKIEEIDK